MHTQSQQQKMKRIPDAAFSGTRLKSLLIHVPRYAIEGQARLAADAGCSRSTVSRLLSGRTTPSVRLARAIAEALSKRSGIAVAVEDVFGAEGSFAQSACQKMGCPGCLPPQAWDERRDRLRPGWTNARPGAWSRARVNTRSA